MVVDSAQELFVFDRGIHDRFAVAEAPLVVAFEGKPNHLERSFLCAINKDFLVLFQNGRRCEEGDLILRHPHHGRIMLVARLEHIDAVFSEWRNDLRECVTHLQVSVELENILTDRDRLVSECDTNGAALEPNYSLGTLSLQYPH